MPNSEMCSGTPCCCVSSQSATTVLEVPKSTARRPGMPILHNRFIDGFPLVRYAYEADRHRRAGLGERGAADRGVVIGVEGHLVADLAGERQAAALQRAHHPPGDGEHVTSLYRLAL